MTLAIDASTKSTGYSIFDKDKLIVYGLITASSTDVIARIYKIINGLKNIISQYSIDTVVLEEVRPENNQYGVGNIHTHKVLMWLQAAIAFMIHDNFKDIQIEYI